MMNRDQLAAMIDHTLLKPEATAAQVADFVAQAKDLGVKAVCVSPNQLPLVDPGNLTVATVCGFPSGAHATGVKALEARTAVENGAAEVDMVVNLAWVMAGDYERAGDEIAAVKAACGDALLKVIIESAVLSDEQIIAMCRQARRVGADFVKTSTGFHPAGGASVHAVELMSHTVGETLGVKASGGIRTLAAAKQMVAAGATRLGLSGSAAILSEFTDSTAAH
ncbi:MAG: deoxyribose-phosphate aldolase [Bowdeniella nasicola]|nr:deoxyribose-phosphate aldolase [Bowdeniella nasicola]